MVWYHVVHAQMRSPQSYSWWGGQWHFFWTASKYFIYGNFNVPILFKLKTTVVKNSRRLFSMSSYVLAMASSCYGSVNSKPTHFPRAFVGFLSFLFGRPANAPQRGRAVHLKKKNNNTHTHTHTRTHRGLEKCANAHPGTIPKLHFPVNKLQMPYLWESVKIWNRFKPLVIMQERSHRSE